ncbi:MAG: NADPH-dependent oxidoreductase [Alphaproteobacteria bacterium]|nr:NADPH-dependent oxidoreductase [Alphaproteobacteria bacterium]
MAEPTADFAALYHDRFGADAPAALAGGRIEGLAPEAAAALAAILARRSYRRFADRPVSDGLAALLLAAAQSAPAKSDLQQLSIIDVRDPARKKRLAELCDTDWMATAPVLLVFCGDLRRVRRLAALRGHPYAQNTLDSFMNAAVDAALAMQTYVVAAEIAGLGTCFVSQVRKRLPAVAETLAIRDGVFPVAGLAAGWPDERRDVTLRLPPAAVVHRDRYDDDALAAAIEAYDRTRNARRAMPAQYKPDKFGTAPFYGWSENATRRLAEPSDLAGLRAFLAGAGIALD